MVILLRIWLYALLLTVANPAAAGKLVILKAIVSVKNNGDTPLNPYYYRLTIPAGDHAQQQLLRIDYPYPEKYVLRPHANGVDHYMKFKWEIPPHTQLVREISFSLRLEPFDYRVKPLRQAPAGGKAFLTPSLHVESDAPEISAIAQRIQRGHPTPEQQLLAAYEYPQKNLRYRNIDNQGALFALRHGIGDCTEYAAIFIAIARNLGIPARMTSEFHFSTDKSFSAPNHHAAEAHLNGAWIPVDPNLALDSALGYGFGYGTERKIVLKRGDSWTWSNSMPKTSQAYRSQYVDTDIRWSISSPRQ